MHSAGLVVEMTEKGVALRWNPNSPGNAPGTTTIHLHRTEGLPPIATQAMRDGLVPIPIDGQTLEMDGQISPEVQIDVPRAPPR